VADDEGIVQRIALQDIVLRAADHRLDRVHCNLGGRSFPVLCPCRHYDGVNEVVQTKEPVAVYSGRLAPSNLKIRRQIEKPSARWAGGSEVETKVPIQRAQLGPDRSVVLGVVQRGGAGNNSIQPGISDERDFAGPDNVFNVVGNQHVGKPAVPDVGVAPGRKRTADRRKNVGGVDHGVRGRHNHQIRAKINNVRGGLKTRPPVEDHRLQIAVKIQRIAGVQNVQNRQQRDRLHHHRHAPYTAERIGVRAALARHQMNARGQRGGHGLAQRVRELGPFALALAHTRCLIHCVGNEVPADRQTVGPETERRVADSEPQIAPDDARGPPTVRDIAVQILDVPREAADPLRNVSKVSDEVCRQRQDQICNPERLHGSGQNRAQLLRVVHRIADKQVGQERLRRQCQETTWIKQLGHPALGILTQAPKSLTPDERAVEREFVEDDKRVVFPARQDRGMLVDPRDRDRRVPAAPIVDATGDETRRVAKQPGKGLLDRCSGDALHGQLVEFLHAIKRCGPTRQASDDANRGLLCGFAVTRIFRNDEHGIGCSRPHQGESAALWEVLCIVSFQNYLRVTDSPVKRVHGGGGEFEPQLLVHGPEVQRELCGRNVRRRPRDNGSSGRPIGRMESGRSVNHHATALNLEDCCRRCVRDGAN